MKSVSAIDVLNKIREALLKRGSTSIRGLGIAFRCIDSVDRNRKADREEFRTGLADMGVSLSKPELDAIIGYLDTDGDGTINFDEFLIGIRGKPNERRQAIIDKAFLKFDKDCNGYIDANDLKGVFNGKLHPKVKSGEKTETQVFMEFLRNFGDKNKDGKIERSEWNDYYAAVSSSVDNDDHFIMLMKQAWKLDQTMIFT
eukprot:TRINITY_DN1751_c0_g1_i1.p1 TRINITY_DN1751_c0_g1~~TRINITY_DN1751_c0_g1_i1.p1  ORF type:complete len:200 (-),score=31.35 TRINITY_DN1751_c0_g1_i1:23-622(-)